LSEFDVKPLCRNQIAAIYPLLREALPTMTLAQWMRLARRLTDPRRGQRSGVMVAQGCNRRHASGLFHYRRERDLRYGWVLVADHFVALDILDAGTVAAAMLEAMEALARKLGCGAIRSVLHPASADLAGGFYSAGHRLEGAALCKELARDPTSETAHDQYPQLNG